MYASLHGWLLYYLLPGDMAVKRHPIKNKKMISNIPVEVTFLD